MVIVVYQVIQGNLVLLVTQVYLDGLDGLVYLVIPDTQGKVVFQANLVSVVLLVIQV